MNETYVKKLIEALPGAGFDAIMLSPGEELRFLMGMNIMLCERFQGLFIKQNGEMFYICNLLYEADVKKELPEGTKIYPWFDGDVMTDVVRSALEAEGLIGATIGVNASAQAFNILEIMNNVDVNFKNGKMVIERIRMIKTPEEMELLRQAAKIADQVFEEVLERIKPGVTEKEIGDWMANRMGELGGADMWQIVAFGPNASYPHYTGNSGVCREHDIVLMDFGCTYKGLYSDTTRTVFVGEPTEREREIYELVKRSNETAEAMVCVGAWAPDIDKKAREVLDEKGYASTLINRLGHGIGYAIHESPDIKQSNPMKLDIGMAFSIEPGVYIGGDIGVRIEDIVMINEKGEREILNKTTKELIVL